MNIKLNKRYWFRTWTTLGTFIGALFGLMVGWNHPTIGLKTFWLGEFFINALRFLVLPLVISSMIVGVTSLGDVRRLGRFGGLTVIYFFLTTCFSVLVGLVLVVLIQPGSGFQSQMVQAPARIFEKANYGFGDFILSFLGGHLDNGKTSSNVFYSLSNMEMLPIVIFSLIFGAVLTTIGENGQVVISFFRGIFEVVMKMILGVVAMAPIGVFGLVAGKVGSLGGGSAVVAELVKVSAYMGTVLAGLFIHALITLPIILIIFAKRSPMAFFRDMSEALITAFSTGSSAATLPVTTKNAIQNAGISQKTATFVLPVGATINMDGTALYEGVAVIFIAQALGVPLALHQYFIVFILSVLAAVAAAAVPEAGLVTMVVILQAVGLPLDGIGLILAVDWFLDRCRTAVNVWGDSVGTAVLDNRSRLVGPVKFEAV